MIASPLHLRRSMFQTAKADNSVLVMAASVIDEFSYFFITFRHFYGGSDNRYDRPIFDNFGPSVPRRAAAPVKLQKRG